MERPPTEASTLFQRLLDIVADLRSPGGCPWDREQTPATIAPYLLEEAHEVLEAVEAGDAQSLCEELGDVLLEVALLGRMAQEQGRFDVSDSLRSICGKLIRRHPHVFGDESCTDPAEVKKTWARIKAEEKKDRGVLEGVPRRLPALHRARRVSEKAAGVGFDWDGPLGVLAKVEEELVELRAALAGGARECIQEEFGDLLFALVNLGRHLDLDAETLLHRATEKFMGRFSQVEETLKDRGRHPAEASLDEMEDLWLRAKARSGPAEPAP